MLGLDWTSWEGVPAHLKTADGTALTDAATQSLALAIGPRMGGAGATNWHLAPYNPFLIDFPGSCPIAYNLLGRALTDMQRHILVCHGYTHGFVINGPPDTKPDLRPSHDYAEPPPVDYTYGDGNDSDEYIYVSSDDDSSEDDDLELSCDLSSNTFQETDAAGVSQTYHRCGGVETMAQIAKLYGLNACDLIKCNDNVLPDGGPGLVPCAGSEVWVSIYED